LRINGLIVKRDHQPRIRHNAQLAVDPVASVRTDVRERAMAARGASIILVATVCGMLTAASAVAETVPLPTPAPWPKTGSAPPSAAKQPATAVAPTAAAPAAPAAKGFFPFSFSLGKSGSATAFDANQRALLEKISGYLSGIQTLVGNFVQVGPDGRRVEGTFSLQKPGKVHFEYKPPSPIDIVADGSSVVVSDRSLETHDYYPLSQTPLRYLLADHINLLRDTDVISVSADDSFATVVIEETQLAVGTSRLMIMFDAKNLQLKQWTVTDPQGLDTTVAVYNLDTAKKPDPNLFVINYPEPPEAGPHSR
jgi:outer membrane lipoprotein-sorting protein